MNIPEEAVEAVKSVLRDEGLDENGGNPHSWRCEFPDLYPNHCTCVDDLARAALEAACAVMHPVLTTPEELEALPDGTVVLDASGLVVQSAMFVFDEHWGVPGSELPVSTQEITLPATVIYSPPPFAPTDWSPGALPIGSSVRDQAGQEWQKVRDDWWHSADGNLSSSSQVLNELLGPLTVIYRP